jgi:hypothetical protein
VAEDLESELLVDEADVGNERVAFVADLADPGRVFDPSELAVGPYPEALNVPVCVVVEPDVRVIEIADAIKMVKGDQHVAVADWDIAWHEGASR